MEKALKHKHHSIFGPKVILFKEDLEQLAELFNSNFGEIEIEADGYKLADISEISELKKDIICDFRISGKEKDNYFDKMSLDISIKSTYISIDSRNDTKCLGVKNKIDEILRSRRRILDIRPFFNSYWSIIILILSIFISPFIFIYYKNVINKEHIELYFLVAFLTIPILWLSLFSLSNFIYNSIHLKYSWEEPNFFKRNKDRIIVGILCAIVGSVGTLILSFIIKKLSNAPNP
jgi:hypothetical protein